MIAPKCFVCSKELEAFGGILLGPPDDQERVRKLHLCAGCCSLAERLPELLAVLDLFWGHMPSEQVLELREDVPTMTELAIEVHQHLWHS